MSVRYDPKGKYFTDVVSKVPVVAWIQTTNQRFRGTVYLHPKETGVGPVGKVIGETHPTGIRPMFGDRLVSAGFKHPAEIYGADTLTLRPPPRRHG